MNTKLREKRMAEYVVVKSYTYGQPYASSKKEVDEQVLNWMEEMIHKYSVEVASSK